jgi:hypothetical protein
MRRQRAFHWLLAAAVAAAAVYGLTTLGGWQRFKDASGISEAAEPHQEIYRALDSQCELVKAARPDDIIDCVAQLHFTETLRLACANSSDIAADHYLVARPGTSQVVAMSCP